MANQDPLIDVLQTAISPVVLISGIGLLVLSMTNRFARTTDRARALAALRDSADDAKRPSIDRQIRILYRRSRLLLWSTSLALTSVLFAALLIVTLFATYLLELDLHALVVALFVLSLACLVASLVFFIKDMSLSLRALRAELGDILK